MSERQMGQVVPFSLSAGKIRKGAYELRRKGRLVEAVELLRRAAQQDDSPAGWLHLAEELRRLHCYEQAATLIYRLLADADAPRQAWMELAYCQIALGRQEAAADSIYHYLAEDPYSDVADEARSLLSTLEEDDDPAAPFRLGQMVRRGLAAWRNGNSELGQRRLARAIWLAREPARLMVTAAMLLMAENRFMEAAQLLACALHWEPDNARAACMLCVAMHALGRKRMALGLLERAAALCDTAEGEEVFLTTAWIISANRARRAFLAEKHRQQPCRITLMHHLANQAWQDGDRQAATGWWQRILRLEPADVRAHALLHYAKEHQEGMLPPMGLLPNVERQAMLQGLMQAEQEHLSPEEMLTPGTDARMAVDWCFTVANPEVQGKCLEALQGQDTPAIRRYMKELLTSPSVLPEVRRRLMIHLAQLGEAGPLNVLMGQRMSTAECMPIPQGQRKPGRMFLVHLLEETRHLQQAELMAGFLSDLWPLLSREDRQAAAGPENYLWVKAVEILYLRMTEQEEAAADAVRRSNVSMRKVGRILRRIARQLAPEPDPEPQMPCAGQDVLAKGD